jgi:enoyl-CoA hydratase/carnithine racemase
MSKAVQYEIDSGVARIKLVTPQSGNALNIDLLEQLNQSIDQAISDKSCRVITISAEGPDFCKGLDLEGIFANGNSPKPQLFNEFLNCLSLICSSSRPVIAIVEGNVTGGGVGLVAACDLVLAKENVVFMLSEVIVGMIPALITPFLLRRLTLARAKYMTLSTRGINAVEAKDFGLVDEVVTEEMFDALNRQLQRLFRASPHALAESKRYFEYLDFGNLHQQKQIAQNQIISWLGQPEVVEGLQIFAEGFSPPWFQKYRVAK